MVKPKWGCGEGNYRATRVILIKDGGRLYCGCNDKDEKIRTTFRI